MPFFPRRLRTTAETWIVNEVLSLRNNEKSHTAFCASPRPRVTVAVRLPFDYRDRRRLSRPRNESRVHLAVGRRVFAVQIRRFYDHLASADWGDWNAASERYRGTCTVHVRIIERKVLVVVCPLACVWKETSREADRTLSFAFDLSVLSFRYDRDTRSIRLIRSQLDDCPIVRSLLHTRTAFHLILLLHRLFFT